MILPYTDPGQYSPSVLTLTQNTGHNIRHSSVNLESSVNKTNIRTYLIRTSSFP